MTLRGPALSALSLSLSRFDDAFARAGATAERDAARLVVVHTNFVKGQVAKTNAMKGLGFWSLADGGEKLEKRSWPAMCAPFSGLRPAKQAAAAPAAQHASKKPSKKPSKPSKKPSSSSESYGGACAAAAVVSTLTS